MTWQAAYTSPPGRRGLPLTDVGAEALPEASEPIAVHATNLWQRHSPYAAGL